MTTAIPVGTKPYMPPQTLGAWRQCETELRDRQFANNAERMRIATQCQESILAAAQGDAAARKQQGKLARQDADLKQTSVNLAQSLTLAAQEIAVWETREAQTVRKADLAVFHEKLADRLALVAEIEKQIRDIAPLLLRLDELTPQIEQAHSMLGGERFILPPLAQEAVGGRLAEFMAGSGFAAWLPLVRPEIRPSLTSWIAAEQGVQKSYRIAV